jgi:hypothetical protein
MAVSISRNAARSLILSGQEHAAPLCCGCDINPDGAGLFMKITTSNELSVDTTRGEQLQIHVRHSVYMIDLCPCKAHCHDQDIAQPTQTVVPLRSSMSHFQGCRASGSAWT